nr:T9SS type A sorting domain-containing protein [uncultured Carboxylicivirga sp.]
MKKLLFFLFTLIIGIKSVMAQGPVLPSQNADLVHTFNGTVKDIKPYDAGIIYIIDNVTNDIIEYSLNGTDFNESERLVNGSASNLSSWTGNTRAFYYGESEDNLLGVELRVNNSGSASLLLNSGHGDHPGLTNVIRSQVNNQDVYFYIGQGTSNSINGEEAFVYETDGTDGGTWNINSGGSGYKPVMLNGLHKNGIFNTYEIDGAVYFAATVSDIGFPNGLFKIEVDPVRGSEISNVLDPQAMGNTWADVYVNEKGYYVKDEVLLGESPFSGAINFYPVENVNNVSSLSGGHFWEEALIEFGNKIFTIVDPFNAGSDKLLIRKVGYINLDDNTVHSINVTLPTTDDEAANLLISGDKLYFSAYSLEYVQGIYAISANDNNPEPVLIKEFTDSEFRGMTAVEGGIAFAYWNEADNMGVVEVTQGYAESGYMLFRGPDNGFYTWGKVTNLLSNGNELFVFEETGNGSEMNIFKHNVAEDGEFKLSTVNFTIEDSETTNTIANATLTLETNLDAFEFQTDENGQTIAEQIPATWYNYTLSAVGYHTKTGSLFLMQGDSYETLVLEADEATNIPDFETVETTVYPNPTDGLITIQSDKAIVKAQVYNVAGSMLFTQQGNDIHTLELSRLSNGIYILVLTNETGITQTIKITKN